MMADTIDDPNILLDMDAATPDIPADVLAGAEPSAMASSQNGHAKPPGRRRGKRPSASDAKGRPPALTIDAMPTAEKYLATSARDELPTLRFWRGSFWRYADGRYAEQSTAEVRARLVAWLGSKYAQLNTGITGNVAECLRAAAFLSSDTEPPHWLGEPPVRADGTRWPKPDKADLLVAANGIVDIAAYLAGRAYLHPPTPRFFSTAALDYAFDADAPEPTLWLQFLRELWPDDAESRAMLQEIFGYVLTADTRQQKIFAVIGPTRSGKGVIARVLRGTIGAANVAGPTLSGLTTNFGMSPLVGKSLAIVSDARLSGRTDQAVITERMLSISGEDSLTIDRKHKEPITVTLPTRLLLLSNEVPAIVDTSGAIVGRMLLLRTTESYLGREDEKLTDKLLAERPGILLWSLIGLARLRDRGHFLQPAGAADALADWNRLASPVGAFLADKCIVGAGHTVHVDSLYAAWRAWSVANGREPGSAQRLGRDLRTVISGLNVVQPRDETGDRHRAYEGVALRTGF